MSYIKGMGFDEGETGVESARRKFRRCAWVVVGVCRMRRGGGEWRRVVEECES